MTSFAKIWLIRYFLITKDAIIIKENTIYNSIKDSYILTKKFLNEKREQIILTSSDKVNVVVDIG